VTARVALAKGHRPR